MQVTVIQPDCITVYLSASANEFECGFQCRCSSLTVFCLPFPAVLFLIVPATCGVEPRQRLNTVRPRSITHFLSYTDIFFPPFVGFYKPQQGKKGRSDCISFRDWEFVDLWDRILLRHKCWKGYFCYFVEMGNMNTPALWP